MKRSLCLLLGAVLLALADARATSTIDPTDQYAWGANIGWTVWRPSAADGVVVGEYVCSGYVYAANVGWINLGSGFPVNNIQYQNNSAADFGVNYTIDPTMPGIAFLRGFAYGANIGWINFDAPGFPLPVGTIKPQLSLFTGTFSGFAYSANCGWINLNDALGKVKTVSVAMGVDTDGDGIADAFEYQYAGNLTGMNGTTDTDHDGIADIDEYREGTNPNLFNDNLRITTFSTNATHTNSPITFMSTAGRLYFIEFKMDLSALSWSLDPNFGTNFAPNMGTSTTVTLLPAGATKRFYRVRSFRPLP